MMDLGLKNHDLLRQAVPVGGRRIDAAGAGIEVANPTTGDAQTIGKVMTDSPIASLFKFGTEVKVVQAANDTEFGLASYFYSTNHARVWRLSEAAES